MYKTKLKLPFEYVQHLQRFLWGQSKKEQTARAVQWYTFQLETRLVFASKKYKKIVINKCQPIANNKQIFPMSYTAPSSFSPFFPLPCMIFNITYFEFLPQKLEYSKRVSRWAVKKHPTIPISVFNVYLNVEMVARSSDEGNSVSPLPTPIYNLPTPIYNLPTPIYNLPNFFQIIFIQVETKIQTVLGW